MDSNFRTDKRCLPVPQFAFASPVSWNQTDIGTQVGYVCDVGYASSSQESGLLRCKETLRWEGASPQCESTSSLCLQGLYILVWSDYRFSFIRRHYVDNKSFCILVFFVLFIISLFFGEIEPISHWSIDLWDLAGVGHLTDKSTLVAGTSAGKMLTIYRNPFDFQSTVPQCERTSQVRA